MRSVEVYVNDTTFSGTVTFEDSREMQTVELDTPVEAESLTIRITDTTEHGGRDFAAVSEIEVWGAP